MARGGSFPLLSAHRISADDDPDFYPTPPWAARAGGALIKRLDPHARSVWEPACGAGHMAHGLRDDFPTVFASDAYPYDGNAIWDFLQEGRPCARELPCEGPDWVVTNPPFNRLDGFIRRAWAHARRGVALLVRAAAIETQGRHQLLTRDCPLTVFAPFSERVPMHKGRWEPDGTTAAFYAWLIFMKPALRPQRFMARIGGELHPAVMWIAPGAEARLSRPGDAGLFGALDRSVGA